MTILSLDIDRLFVVEQYKDIDFLNLSVVGSYRIHLSVADRRLNFKVNPQFENS